MYLFVLPPLSAPDEISHYVSAYQLSSRMLGLPSNDRYGRVMLRPEDAWVEDLEGIRVYEADEDGNLQVTKESLEGNVQFGELLDESTYQTLWELGVSGQYMPERLDHMRGEWVSSQYPPVVTTPLAYVPQAVGISVARLLGMTTVPLLYLGRFCNLLFFVVMTALAMRRLPFGREVLFGVAPVSYTHLDVYKRQVREMVRRAIRLSSFAVIPMLLGLFAVADTLVLALLGEKWMICVPFLRIMCISYCFWPIHITNLQAINAMGRSDIFLKLEIVKKRCV